MNPIIWLNDSKQQPSTVFFCSTCKAPYLQLRISVRIFWGFSSVWGSCCGGSSRRPPGCRSPPGGWRWTPPPPPRPLGSTPHSTSLLRDPPQHSISETRGYREHMGLGHSVNKKETDVIRQHKNESIHSLCGCVARFINPGPENTHRFPWRLVPPWVISPIKGV